MIVGAVVGIKVICWYLAPVNMDVVENKIVVTIEGTAHEVKLVPLMA